MVSAPMVYTTLSIYSWSLFQFTLNLVVTRGRNTGSVTSLSNKSGNEFSANSIVNMANKKRASNSIYIHNELWNVIITLCMQDFPFFILRTVCVFKFNIVSYLFLFFTFKNGILFSLQIYRIIAICTDKDYNFDPLSKSTADASLLQQMANISGSMIPKDINRMSKKIINKNVIDKSTQEHVIIDYGNGGSGGYVGQSNRSNINNSNNNKNIDYYESA
jgi:hypothetical protein